MKLSRGEKYTIWLAYVLVVSAFLDYHGVPGVYVLVGMGMWAFCGYLWIWMTKWKN